MRVNLSTSRWSVRRPVTQLGVAGGAALHPDGGGPETAAVSGPDATRATTRIPGQSRQGDPCGLPFRPGAFFLPFFPVQERSALRLFPRRCAGLFAAEEGADCAFLLLSARRASERTAPYLHLARTQPSALIGCGLPPYHANHDETTPQRSWRHWRAIFSY